MRWVSLASRVALFWCRIVSPGHLDFSSEATAAFRISDGALTFDCILGGAGQIEAVLCHVPGARGAERLREQGRPLHESEAGDRCLEAGCLFLAAPRAEVCAWMVSGVLTGCCVLCHVASVLLKRKFGGSQNTSLSALSLMTFNTVYIHFPFSSRSNGLALLCVAFSS